MKERRKHITIFIVCLKTYNISNNLMDVVLSIFLKRTYLLIGLFLDITNPTLLFLRIR
jgi:hypothetical protein